MARVRDAESTRRRILNAASKEFSIKGFHGTTVSGIAIRAGVSKQLITYHFGSKDKLLQAVHEEHFRVSTPVAEILPNDDPRHLIATRYRKRANETEYIRFWLWEAISANNRSSIASERARSRSAQKYVEAIQEMQASGQITDEFDSRMLQLVVLALSSFPVAFNHTTKIVTGRDGSDPAFQNDWADFLEKVGEKLLSVPKKKR
jgi:AcrR family transcriptional regulator